MTLAAALVYFDGLCIFLCFMGYGYYMKLILREEWNDEPESLRTKRQRFWIRVLPVATVLSLSGLVILVLLAWGIIPWIF